MIALTILTGCQTNVQQGTTGKKISDNSVKIVGAMRNVMHEGQLYGTIDLDTLSNKQHIFGLGPLEYLSGEILILDGKGYKAIMVNDTTMQVYETFAMKAPFFVYANVDRWIETTIPDSITTISQLENYLDQITQNSSRPFCFRLMATVDSAAIHIVNLPKGTTVSSPEEAHQGQKDFFLKGKAVELIGFFSTEHKGIFTHHDSFVHIHLITDDRQQMGHLYDLNMKSGSAKIFLPTQ